MLLKGKIFIDGKIEALTGLSIGGSKSDTVIGGIDNNVIKTSEGVPYVPGSSLKGKMRSLYEQKERGDLCECGNCDICAIFGVSANKRNAKLGPTRLIVRDAFLNEETKMMMEKKTGIFKELELIYTEGKWENVIDRKTSEARHPRQTERVPAGSIFDFNMTFNVFEKKDIDRFNILLSTMSMLEDDYLGGNGSRGYGRIKFIDFDLKVKSIKDYEGDNIPLVLCSKISDISMIINNDDIIAKLSEHLGVE